MKPDGIVFDAKRNAIGFFSFTNSFVFTTFHITTSTQFR